MAFETINPSLVNALQQKAYSSPLSGFGKLALSYFTGGVPGLAMGAMGALKSKPTNPLQTTTNPNDPYGLTNGGGGWYNMLKGGQ